MRVPELRGAARRIVTRVGAVAATSANLHGGPDPRRLDEVPEEIREQAVLVDGGELPGVPRRWSTSQAEEPRILRVGAVSAADVLDALRS